MFRFIWVSIVFVCLCVLCVLCSFSGSMMFFSVVRLGSNWKFWNMKFSFLVCIVVCLFLFSVNRFWLCSLMVLLLGVFRLVRMVSSVFLFEFEVLMMVIDFCVVSLKLMLCRIVSFLVVLCMCLVI